nr:hypothetical protein [Tanacetum cinerariifolium]
MFQKEYIRIESSTQHSSVNDFLVINIPEEDVEPKQIILDSNDQPMWDSAKTVASTPNSAIIQLDIDDTFVINITHLNMIRENKLDGYLRANPHGHIQKLEALTIKMDSQFQSLNEEMRKNYNNCRGDHASMNDYTPMCERDYIQSEGYLNRNSHDSYYQSHYDLVNSEKSLTKLNNDVRNDLEDFKRCVRSMRTVHWKLFSRDDDKTISVLPNKNSKTVNQETQYKSDQEKSITKFLDGQRVTNVFFKNNVNDMIIKMKQNEKNFQTKIKNMYWVIIVINPLYPTTVSFGVDAAMNLKKNTLSV